MLGSKIRGKELGSSFRIPPDCLFDYARLTNRGRDWDATTVITGGVGVQSTANTTTLAG